MGAATARSSAAEEAGGSRLGALFEEVVSMSNDEFFRSGPCVLVEVTSLGWREGAGACEEAGLGNMVCSVGLYQS
jgi:hypothetical protein